MFFHLFSKQAVFTKCDTSGEVKQAILELYRLALEPEGYEVSSASSGSHTLSGYAG
jgi:hypothetical protein